MKRYETPSKPINIDTYFCLEIFSSLRSIFNQRIVKTGAELINNVTNPADMYCRENIKNHPTKKMEAKAVVDASLSNFLLNLSLLKIE